jgi:hypothetical protein
VNKSPGREQSHPWSQGEDMSQTYCEGNCLQRSNHELRLKQQIVIIWEEGSRQGSEHTLWEMKDKKEGRDDARE